MSYVLDIQMVGYVLCPMYYTDHSTSDQYIRKQDGVFSGIKMVRYQMAFKYLTIWHPTSFQPFEYRIVRYSDPHCIRVEMALLSRG